MFPFETETVAAVRTILTGSPGFAELHASGTTILFDLQDDEPLLVEMKPETMAVSVATSTTPSRLKVACTKSQLLALAAGRRASLKVSGDPTEAPLLERCLRLTGADSLDPALLTCLLYLPFALLGSLLQAVLAALGIGALAARLRHAPWVVLGLGLLVIVLPYLGPSPSRAAAAGGSSRSTVEKRFSEQLAQPYALRPQWATLATGTARNMAHYQEAPEVQAELQQRTQTVLDWVHAHPKEAYRVRQEIWTSRLGPDPSRQPQGDFEKQLKQGLDPPSPWAKFSDDFLHRAQGLNATPAALSSEQQQKAAAYALEWLQKNPQVIDSMMATGPTLTGDPMPAAGSQPAPADDSWQTGRRAATTSMPGWILVLGSVLAFKRRDRYQRDWPGTTAKCPA